MGIKCIIFDFDGTLYNGETFESWNKYVKNAIATIFTDSKERDAFILKYPEVRGNIASSKFAEYLTNELGSAEGYVKFECDHIYPLELEKITHLENDYLYELSQKYLLAIVSNSAVPYLRFYLQQFGIKENIFKVLYQNNFDSPLGKGKYYKEIMENFNLKPDEILVLGDNFEYDVKPANELGMRGYHVKTLEELKNIISRVTNE